MKAVDLPAFLAGMKKTPMAIARLIEGLTPAELSWKPAPAAFSLLENVCHLRDIEREGYLVRLRRLREESGPHLADLDGARLAVERRYNEQPLMPAYDAFVAARKMAMKAVADATDDDLAREGTMDQVGGVTLGSMLQMMSVHDAGHLEEMRGLRERLLARRA
jgi:hypothetical protein